MDDLIDGTLDDWPVSLMMYRSWIGAPYCGAHCCAYTGDNDEPSPDEIQIKCSAITDACDGMTKPAAMLRKAEAMGFIKD